MEAKLDTVLGLLMWVLVLKVVLFFVILASVAAVAYYVRHLVRLETRITDLLQLMKEWAKTSVDAGEDTRREVHTVRKQVTENSAAVTAAAQEAATAAQQAVGKTQEIKTAVDQVPTAVVDELKKVDGDSNILKIIVPAKA